MDTSVITFLFAGRNVLVPVSNLIEPPFQRKVRELDPDHVKNLEKQLLETPQLFSVLIGNVCSENNVNIDKIQEDGFPFVEVLVETTPAKLCKIWLIRKASLGKSA